MMAGSFPVLLLMIYFCAAGMKNMTISDAEKEYTDEECIDCSRNHDYDSSKWNMDDELP